MARAGSQPAHLWAIVACVAAAPPARAGVEAPPLLGVWRNAESSLRVEIRPCPPGFCDAIVWAAGDTAASGQATPLKGKTVFRDFAESGNGRWHGVIVLPRRQIELPGEVELVDDNTLRATGCLVAKVGCKNQIWRRVHSPDNVADRLPSGHPLVR